MEDPVHPAPPDKRINLYFKSQNIQARISKVFNTFQSAFWLGFLHREHLHHIDEHYYSNWDMYASPEHNARGLFAWEKKFVEGYLKDKKSVLVPAAGGGREMIALGKMGYHCRGFECHRDLLDAGVANLKAQDLNFTLNYEERDSCPDYTENFDASIIGWSAYMYIVGSETRTQFLKSIAGNLKPGAPILVSFFTRDSGTGANQSGFGKARFAFIKYMANTLKIFGRNRPTVECGDCLEPGYVHFFTRDEIEWEFKRAGFSLLEYSNDGLGTAVGQLN